MAPDRARLDRRARGSRLHARHRRGLSVAGEAIQTMSQGVETRHLGLDLGATNLKWAVLAQAGGSWTTVVTDQESTRVVADPAAVPATIVAQLAEVAAAAIAEWGPVLSVGIGVPGLYDPAGGATRFLVNVPGHWAGRPVAGPVSAAVGLPTFLVNDARAFGLAELR